MALVKKVEWNGQGGRKHPTSVECEVRVIEDGGVTYLQLSSFGSDARASEKKVSQTLQFGRKEALELGAYIEQAFGRPWA